ncbi:DUF4012 domain-containing protein [Candidatus Peregrinibacteria bacterium]|nr:DUF4012 domain-containing protein [Candidatus Peregrinibacteria bacterium]
MARIIFTDLKKSKDKKLNLKSEVKKERVKRNHLLDISENSGNKSIYNQAKSKKIVDIHAQSKKSNSYYFVPEENLKKPILKKYTEPLKLMASGLILVFLFNLINVFENGFALTNTITASAESAVSQIQNATESGKQADFSNAENSFSLAETDFDTALENISYLRTSQESIFVKEQNIESLNNLLEAGKAISRAGKHFSRSINNLKNLPELFISENQNILKDNQNGSETNLSITDLINKELPYLDLIIEELQDAKNNLSQISSHFITEDLKEKINSLRISLEKILVLLKDQKSNLPSILKLLGDRYPHRYLILLQNDSEARPTGGFIGSLMIIDVNEGYISGTQFHDVYRFDGQLKEPIEAPEEISEITDEWRLRDSNFSPDFALSAEKAAWFLQKSRGPSVDTVIAINLSFVNQLLKVVGELDVEGLKAPVNSENFQFIISYLVESKEFGENSPKVILENAITSFKARLLTMDNYQPLLQNLIEGIKDQKIMFYSRHQDVQELFDKFHLTPRQLELEPDQDYLQVIATSIGGNKSDQYILQELDHQTFIKSDGTIFNELKITREHTWTESELLKWKSYLEEFGYRELPEYLIYILGGGENISNIRVYVPFGAELENAVGVSLEDVKTRHDSQLNKTYFLYKMKTLPGETNSITLRYKLPFKLDLLPADQYRFAAQKQSGSIETIISKQINPGINQKILKEFPEKSGDKYIQVLDGTFHQATVISN